MKPASHLSASQGAGFTLVEMTVALAIVGVLVALALPTFRDAIYNGRMVSMANDAMADLNIARSEAVKRNASVVLCPSSDNVTCSGGTNWARGWIVYHDVNLDGLRSVGNEDLIKATPPLTNTNPNAINVTRGGTPIGTISYGPSGGVAGAQQILLTFCDIRAGTASGATFMRQVTINVTGRPVVTRWTCATP